MEATILLVEDDGALREGLCELLAREGYRTKSAATAREADALIQAGSFDLCLMDVGLPDGDGVSCAAVGARKGEIFPLYFSPRWTRKSTWCARWTRAAAITWPSRFARWNC